MSTLFDRIKADLPAIPASAHFGDVMKVIQVALLKIIPAAEVLFGPGNGAEKKEAVLVAIEKFYDTSIAPLDLPWVPNLWIEPLVDKQLRTLIRPVFGPVIDAIVTAFNGKLPVVVPVVVPPTPPAPQPLPPFDGGDHEGVG